jgi:hypothetical protein
MKPAGFKRAPGILRRQKAGPGYQLVYELPAPAAG